jgi:hypothetical protein
MIKATIIKILRLCIFNTSLKIIRYSVRANFSTEKLSIFTLNLAEFEATTVIDVKSEGKKMAVRISTTT